MSARTRKNWKSFEEAREWVRLLGIQTYREWRHYVSFGLPDKPNLPEDIPKAPNDVYIDEFEGFADWLGKERLAITLPRKSPSESVRSDKSVYLNFYEARKFVIKRKFNSPTIYRSTVRNRSKSIQNRKAHGKPITSTMEFFGQLPIYPERVYDEWTTWADYLGLSEEELFNLEWMSKRIRELRSKYNYTITQLAREIGTSPRSLTRFEKAESFPPGDIIFKLMNFAAAKNPYLVKEKRYQKSDIIFLEETKNSKEILSAVKNMEIRFAHDFKTQDEIDIGKEFFKNIFDYKVQAGSTPKGDHNKIEKQRALLNAELQLSDRIIELSNYGYYIFEDHWENKPFGIFIYNKGALVVENEYLPCVLIYIGPLKDDRIKKRGKHGMNIALDIKEFGLDEKTEKWETIFQKKIWWSCPDYGHEWHIPLSISPDAKCPICTMWDSKKNQGTPLDEIKSESTNQYWWRCESDHGFKFSPVEFQKLDGRCPICIQPKRPYNKAL